MKISRFIAGETLLIADVKIGDYLAAMACRMGKWPKNEAVIAYVVEVTKILEHKNVETCMQEMQFEGVIVAVNKKEMDKHGKDHDYDVGKVNTLYIYDNVIDGVRKPASIWCAATKTKREKVNHARSDQL